MKVGFIGLGRMGHAIATRILGGGHDLVVYNRTRSKAAELEHGGATVAGTIAEAAEDREVVFTMLADDEALKEVSEHGIIAALPKGAIHAPMGTHGVTVITDLEKAHAAADQVLVACPVLGRPAAAAAGELGLVPAGPAAAVAAMQPVLKDCGRKIINAGTSPAGAIAVKLANNMMLGCAIEAMGEGFALTRKFGVDSSVLYEVLSGGLFASPAYNIYGDIIAREAYEEVGFTANLGFKDTDLMLAAGEAAQVPLPSCEIYRDRLRGAIAHGEGELDWAVIARDQARASGLE